MKNPQQKNTLKSLGAMLHILIVNHAKNKIVSQHFMDSINDLNIKRILNKINNDNERSLNDLCKAIGQKELLDYVQREINNEDRIVYLLQNDEQVNRFSTESLILHVESIEKEIMPNLIEPNANQKTIEYERS